MKEKEEEVTVPFAISLRRAEACVHDELNGTRNGFLPPRCRGGHRIYSDQSRSMQGPHVGLTEAVRELEFRSYFVVLLWREEYPACVITINLHTASTMQRTHDPYLRTHTMRIFRAEPILMHASSA